MPGKHKFYCGVTDYQFMNGDTRTHCQDLGIPQCRACEKRQRSLDMQEDIKSMMCSWNTGGRNDSEPRE